MVLRVFRTIWWNYSLLVVLFCDISFGIEEDTTPSYTSDAPTTNAFGHTMEQCPPPVDPSLLNLPFAHIRNLVTQYPNYIRYYCNDCDKCILETYNRYAKHFLLEGPGTCWGYEMNPPCPRNLRFLPPPNCTKFHTHIKSGGIVRKSDLFYEQGDFGYVYHQRRQLKTICDPAAPSHSVLECTDNVLFCRGRDIMISFLGLLQRKEPVRYHTDVLKRGEMGARCSLNRTKLGEHMDYMSPLQSWAPELRNFVQMKVDPLEACDVVIERPTFIMKIDATGNMYHHFCDFLNLYAAQHVNSSDPTAFSTDINILIWETYPYKTPFAATFNAFTHHPIMTLNDVAGKKVCFRKLVLPLLPRMIFGMYYNTPLEPNCSKSALFDAFSEHILHRLRVPLHAKPRPFAIRVTFLERLTMYRKVVNSEELVSALSEDPQFIVTKVNFENYNFMEQLEIIRNSDILVGMHGAGLTHLLFLPRWATLFELYNCGDAACYRDLARLRGIDYITWEKPDKMVHGIPPTRTESVEVAKFTNYSFDPAEFVRMMNKALDKLVQNPHFQNYVQATASSRTFDEQMFGGQSTFEQKGRMAEEL